MEELHADKPERVIVTGVDAETVITALGYMGVSGFEVEAITAEEDPANFATYDDLVEFLKANNNEKEALQIASRIWNGLRQIDTGAQGARLLKPGYGVDLRELESRLEPGRRPELHAPHKIGPSGRRDLRRFVELRKEATKTDSDPN